MNHRRLQALSFTVLLLLIPAFAFAQAQEQAKKGSQEQQKVSHLRLDFLLNEYDGQQKTSSLPYTMYVDTYGRSRGDLGRLRMGVKVPVPTGNFSNGAPSQFQYQDIGTNIDCSAAELEEGAYDLNINLNRSMVYSATQSRSGAEPLHSAGGLPVIRTFNTSFDLRMHDGETTEGPSATDPFNGHVLKISVTLHVLK